MSFGYANLQDRVYQTYTLKKTKNKPLSLVFPVFSAHMHKKYSPSAPLKDIKKKDMVKI